MSAACIIQAGSEAFINKYILSTKIFVRVGKISYPLYLWHWPLLVFSRFFYPEGSKSVYANLYVIISITIGLSILTYVVVEKPLRKRKSKIIALILLILMASIGYWSYQNLRANRIKSNLYDKDEI